MRIALLTLTTMAIAACTSGNGFDSAEWKAAAGCEGGADYGDYPRLAMYTALERDHLREGIPQAEVLDLLGEPENKSGAVFSYCLGYNIIDYDYYRIEFDADGRMESWRYVQG